MKIISDNSKAMKPSKSPSCQCSSMPLWAASQRTVHHGRNVTQSRHLIRVLARKQLQGLRQEPSEGSQLCVQFNHNKWLSRRLDHDYTSNFSKWNTILVTQKGEVQVLKMAITQALFCSYSDICQETLVGPRSDLSADACLLSLASCS